jgi:hypothetical protein
MPGSGDAFERLTERFPSIDPAVIADLLEGCSERDAVDFLLMQVLHAPTPTAQTLHLVLVILTVGQPAF